MTQRLQRRLCLSAVGLLLGVTVAFAAPRPPGPNSIVVNLAPPTAAVPDAPREVGSALQLADSPVAKIHHYGTGVGYVLGVEPVYTMLPRNAPWEIKVVCEPLALDGGTPAQAIPPSRVQFHELKSDPGGNGWVDCSGEGSLYDFVGDADGWLYLESRIELEYVDAPGHYVGNAYLEFTVYPEGWPEPYTGRIPLEIHLNMVPVLGVTLEPELIFPNTEGNFNGWMYTTNEAKLTVSSNVNFTISIDTAGDLAGPGTQTHQIETALRLWQPWGSGSLWGTWADVGDDESGHGTPDQWATVARDPGGPWPGAVQNPGVVVTQGINEIGLRGAAYRQGVQDLAGDYASPLTITISTLP